MQRELFDFLEKAQVIQTEKKGKKSAQLPSPSENPKPPSAVFINPRSRLYTRGSGRNVIEPNRRINYRVLRTVSEKAWIVNLIIGHQCRQIRPFLKTSTDENKRGFQVRTKDREHKPTSFEKDVCRLYEKFFLQTGVDKDPDRGDLVSFCTKAHRDQKTLDQLTTELQRTRSGKLYAFWAVDPATIYKVNELGYDGNDKIRFIQEIDMLVTAKYRQEDLIFDFENPRSDVEFSGYGYSDTEQAIDLVTGFINSYMYNMGVFTEDKLPRGMILLNGDAGLEEVEAIEDYIVDIMSGPPSSKWKIPIIPAGATGKGREGQRQFEWISFQNSNKDMEFSQWTETIWTAIAAKFGTDLAEVGIRTQKSTPLIGPDVTPRIEESKSRGLSTALTFLESHLQKILEQIDERYDFEFVGYERDDPKVKNDIRESRLRTDTSIDELRAEDDKKPFGEAWSKIPLNPQVVQLFLAAKQAEQMQQQGAMGGGMPGMGGAPGAQAGQPGQDTDLGDIGKYHYDDDDQEEGEQESMYRTMLSGESAEKPKKTASIGKSIDQDVIEIRV